ncbi:tetratricopeptide repeat protein [Desulfuromonas acetoxidans]|uniref:tetratricopeptide repeat protein n=1 Tax=Desulfuromonas acetoxidans TaxID=891 RepID=UPI00292ED7F1|nr:hypothetical protein [Desulfuromonas acetoxidans]
MRNNLERPFSIMFYVMLMVIFAFLATLSPMGYIWLTYEDLLGEWSQFYLFAATLVCAATLARHKNRWRFFFALLALSCLYVSGEEISWGQRLLNLETPAFFQQHNLQQETNLHNFITGPYNTLLKQSIEIALAMALILFSTLYALRISERIPGVAALKRWLPPPPLFLWPYFCTAALFELRLLRFNEAELAEILVGAAMLLYTLHYLHRHAPSVVHQSSVRPQATALCTVIFLALYTTGLCYSSPRLRHGMEARIDNGVKKFADRYGRYGQWHHSRHLYMKLLQERPESVALRQRLAFAEKKLGHGLQAAQTLTEAIRLDMRRYGREPGNIAVNLSLAQSFELLGNLERMAFHHKQALDYGLRKVSLEPDNAHANYWLGRSYLANGAVDKAVKQFERAAQLQPTTYRFQRALQEARLKLQFLPG